eukprot:CAMPEP_0194486644 /NCGR_PEP_ID=MMETSP0253-20130528/7215_1 /TAXON_ID=2966 /ORGANISM="Noctiluca scintillans" /LENGTH=87 /DNA_ID=CAMNT_0039326757 /DNA_START=137 /DNA_END=400 /DNA_ORIENTATION=+
MNFARVITLFILGVLVQVTAPIIARIIAGTIAGTIAEFIAEIVTGGVAQVVFTTAAIAVQLRIVARQKGIFGVTVRRRLHTCGFLEH